MTKPETKKLEKVKRDAQDADMAFERFHRAIGQGKDPWEAQEDFDAGHRSLRMALREVNSILETTDR